MGYTFLYNILISKLARTKTCPTILDENSIHQYVDHVYTIVTVVSPSNVIDFHR